jgi:hypothetical protein
VATYCAVHVLTPRLDAVVEAIAVELTERGRRPSVASGIDFPHDLYKLSAGFFTGKASMWAVGQVTPECVVAHFASFDTQDDLADRLSAELDARVVVTLIQTVSESHYVGVHEGGRLRRRLSVDDYVDGFDEGEAFEFEAELRAEAHAELEELDEMPEDPESPSSWFDAIPYTEALGAACWRDIASTRWTVLRPPKRWWRFW